MNLRERIEAVVRELRGCYEPTAERMADRLEAELRESKKEETT